MYKKLYCFSFKLGFFVLFAHSERIKLLMKHGIRVWLAVLPNLSVQEQKQFLQFLSLNYIEGKSMYKLVINYKRTLRPRQRRIYNVLLGLLKAGLSFPRIIAETKLFKRELMVIFFIAEKTGDFREAVLDAGKQIKEDQKRKKVAIKTLSYPVILALSVYFMLYFLAIVVLPQMKMFISSGNQRTPFIIEFFTPLTLAGVSVLVGLVLLIVSLILRKLPVSIYEKLPVYKQILTYRFETVFLDILLKSSKHGLSLDVVLEDLAKKSKERFLAYYLSTIDARLKQGMDLHQATDIAVISNKYKYIFAGHEATKIKEYLELLENIIAEIREEYQEYIEKGIVAINVMLLLVVALIIMVIGYVSFIPLQGLIDNL